ncbi:Crp/Fnr family transcriptional regulator [Sphaerisporangium dianthi]|uniref:Crp/Fnr family transcriptional regulator n=1 Tax=Sphaerisporangium dianthi TaxID=1436120 RepID=A0ABV9CF56_9ACTN
MTGPAPRRPCVIRNVGQWPRRGLLGGLTAEARDELLALGRPWQYAAGTALVTQGEWSDEAILLLDGCVKLTITPPAPGPAPAPGLGPATGTRPTGTTGTLSTGRNGTGPGPAIGSGPAAGAGVPALAGIRVGGDLVGEVAVLAGQRQEATATAADACLARLIPPRELARLAVRFPDFARALYGAAAGHNASARWYPAGADTAMGRLVRVLVELGRSYGEPVPEGVMIGVSLTRPELAGLVDAPEPAVYRALTVLRRTGVLGTGYRRIVVHDIRGLRAFVASGDVPPGDERAHEYPVEHLLNQGRDPLHTEDAPAGPPRGPLVGGGLVGERRGPAGAGGGPVGNGRGPVVAGGGPVGEGHGPVVAGGGPEGEGRGLADREGPVDDGRGPGDDGARR